MWVFVDLFSSAASLLAFIFLMCDGKRAEILRFLCEPWAAGSKVLWVRTIFFKIPFHYVMNNFVKFIQHLVFFVILVISWEQDEDHQKGLLLRILRNEIRSCSVTNYT